jgi:hypothetical protein
MDKCEEYLISIFDLIKEIKNTTNNMNEFISRVRNRLTYRWKVQSDGYNGFLFFDDKVYISDNSKKVLQQCCNILSLKDEDINDMSRENINQYTDTTFLKILFFYFTSL